MTEPEQQPDTLDRLMQQAPVLKVDPSLSIKLYINSARKLYDEAVRVYRFQMGQKGLKQKEEAYILLLRFVNLMIYTLPSHKDFGNMTFKTEIKDLKTKCQERYKKERRM
jgi:hypothetical protein